MNECKGCLYDNCSACGWGFGSQSEIENFGENCINCPCGAGMECRHNKGCSNYEVEGEKSLKNKMQERIILAAIKFDDTVLVGRRHAEIMSLFREYYPSVTYITQAQQGFLTTQGRFVSRIEAAQIAIDCGQLRKDWNRTLTSEDLW